MDANEALSALRRWAEANRCSKDGCKRPLHQGVELFDTLDEAMSKGREPIPDAWDQHPTA